MNPTAITSGPIAEAPTPNAVATPLIAPMFAVPNHLGYRTDVSARIEPPLTPRRSEYKAAVNPGLTQIYEMWAAARES